MRIDGAIPIHVARAYGIQAPPRPAASPPSRNAPAARAEIAGAPAEKIRQLLAGKVNGPINFSSASSPRPSGSLQMYNRAADRMEAAVAVQLGRTLDVRG